MPISPHLAALPYYGGKNPRAGRSSGVWIAGLLPHRRLYCEPFGGMFSVGLIRGPSFVEIYNDADQRVVAWWRAVREQPAEFGRRVEATPMSRVEYLAALKRLDDPDPMRRALAVHVMLEQGMARGLGARSGWSCQYKGNRRVLAMGADRVARLADRMRGVQLECRDACEILERTAGVDNAVVYVDPPYPGADVTAYGVTDVDYDRLAAALLAQRGVCAVSGIGDNWDRLGWHRHEHAVRLGMRAGGADDRRLRTEVLWINTSPVDSGARLV